MRFFKRLSIVVFTVLIGFSAQSVSADQLSKDHVIQWLVHHALLNGAPGKPRQGTAVRVGYPKHKLAPGKTASVVVVNKVATYWVSQPHGSGRIRITVPVRYYLSSWDVQALERELERLGVKVKPRPMPPKPGPVSG